LVKTDKMCRIAESIPLCLWACDNKAMQYARKWKITKIWIGLQPDNNPQGCAIVVYSNIKCI
jgi:hypothetical protein